MKSRNQIREMSTGANQREVQRYIVELARFRYGLRKFLRFSENAARSCGITPQQHQLMLGVAGFTGRGSATVSELAEFLQGRIHSIVGLVERAEQSGLVRCAKSDEDRRVVVVSLSRRGEEILSQLSALHHEQSKRLRAFLLDPEVTRKLPEKQEKRVAPRRGVSRKSPAGRKL
jgi:DNA-binding MarR family transcriptional regulator